jgi:NADPH:quinone reductase-like Zn-dependent oxidoreductase
MLRLFDDGLKPAIDRVFELDDGIAAFERLAATHQFGKIVISM